MTPQEPWLAIPAPGPWPSQSQSPSPSSAQSAGTPGRPSKWTASAQRKLTCLYVYTTLSLDTIIRLVHARLPASTPG